MYHGTNEAAAVEIKKCGQHGLRPSGAGIYCSRDLEMARGHAGTCGSRKKGGVIFELRVKPGRIIRTHVVNGPGLPFGRSWQDAGYDSAWVPEGANLSGREQLCVWDPKRVRIVGVAWSDCGFTW
jgi:hypothetical protein